MKNVAETNCICSCTGDSCFSDAVALKIAVLAIHVLQRLVIKPSFDIIFFTILL